MASTLKSVQSSSGKDTTATVEVLASHGGALKSATATTTTDGKPVLFPAKKTKK